MQLPSKYAKETLRFYFNEKENEAYFVIWARDHVVDGRFVRKDDWIEFMPFENWMPGNYELELPSNENPNRNERIIFSIN